MRLHLNRPLDAPAMKIRRIRPPRIERGEKYYYIDVTIGGKRSSLSTRCTDPDRAARVRDSWAEEEEARLRETQEWSLEECFLEVDRQRLDANPRSQPFGARVLELVEPEWRARGLSQVSEEEWLAWRDTMERTRSKATARRYMSFVKGAYRDAVKARRCLGNTVDRITLGGVTRSRQRSVPYEDLCRVQEWLAENAAHDYLRFLFAWQATTGFRIRTSLQMTWGMVDLEATPARTDIPGDLTKTGEPIRSYLSTEARRILRLWRHVVEQSEQRKVEPYETIWPRDYSTVRSRWVSACRQAKIKPYSIHDLKRTFFDICARTGVPWHLCAKMCGNASAQVVLDHYSEITPETAQAIFEGRPAPQESGGDPLPPLPTGGVWIQPSMSVRGEPGYSLDEV